MIFTKTQLTGFAALTLAACSSTEEGRSAAKVSEIEWTVQQSGQTQLGRLEVDYEDDQIKEIAYRDNGEAAGRMDFQYGSSGSLIDQIDVTDTEGDPATYDWDYGDGRLKSIRWSVADILSAEQEFEYDDANAGRPRRVTSTTSWAGATPTSAVASYDYDAQGRLEEITSVQGDTTQTTELRYDEASRIERYTQYAGGDVMDAELSYDEQGRLERVETDDDRYEITYDADGLIEEILILSPGQSRTTTVRYRYEPGEVAGLTFHPDLPIAGMIDLRGQAFDQTDFTAFAPPLGLGDVPSVEISSCAHDVCVAGTALDASCDSCAASVCGQDSYCCTSSWDAQCVQMASDLCGC